MKEGFTINRAGLDGVEAFLRVAERRNFRLAASDLGVSSSAVSQQIRALEQRVGVALLVRTTRSVGLTQAGQIFLRNAAPALNQLASAYDEVRNLSAPAGLLRLHMPRGVVPMIEPLLGDFCNTFNRIDIEIRTSDEAVDLAAQGFDAGINLREYLDSDAVAVRLVGPLSFAVVGAPAYLDVHGRPKSPYDLKAHNCIRIVHDRKVQSHWSFLDGQRTISVPVSGRIVSDDYSLGVDAARRGLGLNLVAIEVVAGELADGRMEAFFEDLIPASGGLFLHYPSRTQVLPKLRVFIDYVRQKIGPNLLA